MSDWLPDKKWTDAYMPEIKRICGEHLLGQAPEEEDVHHNTDLIVLRMSAIRIGVRIRRPGYLANFHDQFTLRTSRPSGADTERAKIIAGWGDYFFYGFAGKDGTLDCWLLGDLKVFRRWHSVRLALDEGRVPGERLANADGSSTFCAYRISDLPADFVIARLTATVDQPVLW